MKLTFFLIILLVTGISTTAQITAAGSGLTQYGGAVYLGGELLQTTHIDLGNNFSLHVNRNTNKLFSIYGNGNVSLGAPQADAHLLFPNLHESEYANGITWFDQDPTSYAIHRTAGPWLHPNYQQLRLGWVTGIVLDPGTSHGKSYVEIVGNGLRVTQGNVGIGNASPHSKLEVGSSPEADQNPYTATAWDTYNARFNNGNVSIFSPGEATHPGYSYQLNFYARYHDGSVGSITSKGAYLKGSVLTVRTNEAAPWTGQGTLILGSTNTTYSPAGFTDVPAMYLSNGQVGLGIAAPEAQLHTTGSIRFAGLTNDNAKDRVIVSDANGNLSYRDAATLGGGSSTTGWAFGGNAVTASSTLGTTSNYDLQIITSNTERMRVAANGSVFINPVATVGTDYKLNVNGFIRTRKVRVDQDNWADYVFDNNYRLRSIREVEEYIQAEKHLPDVPSAAEVKKEGLDLGNNQATLLQKIEELTLYIIQQQKQLEAQQKRIEMLEKKAENK